MEIEDSLDNQILTQFPDPQNIAVPSDIADILDDYIESTSSQLQQLEKVVLDFENGIDQNENLAAIKRILHKIKGESAMVGFEDIAQVCHQTESAIEELTPNDLPDMLLKFKDWTDQAIESITL